MKVPVAFGVEDTMDVLLASGLICDDADGYQECGDDVLILSFLISLLDHFVFSVGFLNCCN